jgi:serine/threonine protein kinase
LQEFECGKILGSGAFAEVRLCTRRSTGQKYAAKCIDKQKFAMNKELRSGSFRDEIDILKSLQHPYIVECADIFETDRFLVIILQYVDGGDLFDLLVSVKRFAEGK